MASPRHSPEHISADDYYRLPVRPIYKSYPAYHVAKEEGGRKKEEERR